jgi:hypothetical protein
MTRTRRRFGSLAFTLGTATLTIGLGVATGAKLKAESASTSIDPNTAASATAVCERGTRTISGGFELVPPESAGLFPIASEGRTPRSGAFEPIPRRWRSTAVNLGDDPAALTSYAYCRDQKELRDDLGGSSWFKDSLASGQERRFRLRCQGGGRALRQGRAISGSFSAEHDENTSVRIRASHRVSSHRWTVVAKALGTDPFARVSATVYCTNRRVFTKSKTAIASGGAPTDAVARCKRGQRVVSGGFETENFAAEGGPFVYASRKQGRRKWLVRVFATEPEEFTAYAYCEKKRPR